MKKLVCMLLAAMLMLCVLPAVSATGTAGDEEPFEAPLNPGAVGTKDEDEFEYDPDEEVTFIVKLKDAPLAAGLSDLRSAGAAEASERLVKKQRGVMDGVSALFGGGSKPEFRFSYTLLFNGFAVKAPVRMRSAIAELEGVESVFISPKYAAFEEADSIERLMAMTEPLVSGEAARSGYTGKGTVIAVIDSGCVLGHDAFSVSPDSPKMDVHYLTNALENSAMQAESLYSGTLTASELYYSDKIPFRFNYFDGSLNVADSFSGADQGTHMAGVAAGSDPNSGYSGVAGDAQLAVMQVCGTKGDSDWATVLAALEDCAYLGVDAVGLSFGRDIGPSYGGEEIESVFSLLAQHGVNVSVAAGDSASSNGQQYYGSTFGYALAMNPDNGIVSAPGTYAGPLCVASCNSDGSGMASFSSAGTTSDLLLKPELTAPGVNINGPVDPSCSGETSQYGVKSSTAMSSAQVSGAQAIMSGLVKQNWPALSPAEAAAMADRLLMCTADPIPGVSPRLQGSGVMNIDKAVSTLAYVTVNGNARPKLELGDDPDRSGVFTLDFSIVNFGGEELVFTPNVSVLTPTLASRSMNGNTVRYMKGTSRDVTSYCMIEAPASVTVPAGGSAQVSITVTLSPSIKAEFDSTSPNGMYVEGFVVLEGGADLSLPFLGFYGSWNSASVFDRYTFIDEIMGLPQYNVHTKRTAVGSYINGTEFMLFGANPYIESSDWLKERCTLSPNGDGYYDDISRVTAALLRCARSGRLAITDADDGTVYYSETLGRTPKSWRYRTGNYSYSWSYASDGFSFVSWDPSSLPEGVHPVFELSFELDNPGFTHEQNECSRIILPMTVDVTPPSATAWSLDGGVLDITVHDDNYAAWIGVYSDIACTDLIGERAIAETERGASTELSIQVGSRSRVYVRLGDYGRNTSEVYTVFGEGPIALESASLDPAEITLIPGQTAAVNAVLTPENASILRVDWSVSDARPASVTGNASAAEITAIERGSCTVTAVITDALGNRITAEAPVTVLNGYEFDHYEPASVIDPDSEYLIGFNTGDEVYLLMNMNPDPIEDELLYSYENENHCYGIRAALDAEGNVTGLDDPRYPDAMLMHVQWYFIPVSSYYQIRSASSASYYLKVSSGSVSVGLMPAFGTGNSTKWTWDPSGSRLGYLGLSGMKTVSYAETVGEYSSFFNAPLNGNENSSITLYKHVTGTVIIEDPVYYTVTFVDWDGTVLDVQQVEEGSAAAAPDDPHRIGWIFTGWGCDFSCVTSDLTVTATYEQIPPLIGDSNCDGRVTMADVSTLIAHVMNIAPLTEQGYLNADANRDGQTDILDAAAIYAIAMVS